MGTKGRVTSPAPMSYCPSTRVTQHEVSSFKEESTTFPQDISGMLRDAIDDENSADGGEEQAGIADSCGGGAAANRPPVRPTSAPPARGRRPQPSNSSGNQQASAAGIVLAAGGVRRGEEGGGVAAGAGVSEDDDSFGKDSHDLRGFDELEGETAAAFSYEDYPAAGSPEEPEWIHDPWCGTNSGDIPVVDKNEVLGGGGGGNPGEKEVPASSPVASPTSSAERVDAEVVETAVGVGEDRGDLTAIVSPLSSVTDGGEGPYDGRDVCGKGTPPRVSRRASAPRTVAGGKELKRYDWGGADAVPTKPALLAASRIPTGNRADKQRHRNAKKKDANRKVGCVMRAVGLVGSQGEHAHCCWAWTCQTRCSTHCRSSRSLQDKTENHF